jgi:CheY-like chemotaxis protein
MGKDDAIPSKEGMPLLGFSILVVNEDLGNRELASHILEELGACVDKAEQAVEAIEAIKHQQYHAVLIDEEIMCSDSEDITGLVKARSRNPNTAVIISGSLMVTRNEAIVSGADGYIEKPLDENEVLQSLISSQKQH